MDFIEMIKSLVTPLTNNPEAISVKEGESDQPKTLLFEVTVATEDLGRVIGREGRVANAIRTLAYAAAIKEGFRIKLTFAANE